MFCVFFVMFFDVIVDDVECGGNDSCVICEFEGGNEVRDYICWEYEICKGGEEYVMYLWWGFGVGCVIIYG